MASATLELYGGRAKHFGSHGGGSIKRYLSRSTRLRPPRRSDARGAQALCVGRLGRVTGTAGRGAGGYVNEGYELIKIRAGKDLQADVKRVNAAHEATGGRAKLAVDAVQGHHPSPWHASTALAFVEQIEPLRLAWLEEPCGNSDWEGYATVRRHTRIPIAGGESANGMLQFRRICEMGAVDIIQPDVCHVGGLHEMQRIVSLASSFGVRTIPHVWGAGVGIMASYPFCFATDDCPLAEYPTWESPLRSELVSPSVQLGAGAVRRPETPGLGVELRDETIQKYPYTPGVGVEMVTGNR
jgi:D-galactarolactone cycloisomerase